MQANDLEVLLRSRVPIIVVDSRDEAQVLNVLGAACKQLPSPPPVSRPPGAGVAPARSGLPLFQWTVTDGLKRLDQDLGPPLRTVAQPPDILKHIRATPLAGVYALLDFHPYLQDPTIVRLLKDVAQDYERCARTVVLIGYQTEIPHELEHLAARVALAFPIATSGANWSRTWRGSGCVPIPARP